MKYFINPFERIAGWQALVIVAVMSLGCLLTNSPAIASETYSAENATLFVDTLSIRQKTEKVVKALEKENFDAIAVYFDENMKKQLTPSLLKMAWTQTGVTCGRFEKADLDALTEARIQNFDVIEVPLHFQKENRKLRLAFNSNGEISGMFFLPVN